MITVNLVGRLGNQMFQYAICRTIAEINNYDFFISTDINNHGQNISNYFDIDMGKYDGSNIHNVFSEDTLIQKYNPDILNIPDNSVLIGFFQTEKYFSNNEKNIKDWFKIDTDIQIDELLDKYPIDEYCYVHFRGTDYKDWDDGNMFLPLKYYTDSISKIKEHNNDIKFLIITDDITLASKYFTNYDIISNDMMIDFKMLYYSKYCIISNSTFSWWAAWLSDDKLITIAPDNWLNYNRPERGFYPADIKTEKFTYV